MMPSHRAWVLFVLVASLATTISPATQSERPAAPAAAPSMPPKLAQYKQEAVASIDGMYDLAQQMVDTVFSFGELGFQEFETQRYLTGILEKEGFTVQRGVAGIPTAWMARFGSGKPVIALGSDVDCIPQASQKPGVAYRDPIIDGAPGHGEGHNSGMPLNIVAAIAVKRMMEREKLPGTIVLWPGVAEEQLGDKGVLRARRALQGRRRGALQPRRQPTWRRAGETARATASSRSSTRSRARRRTAPECAVARPQRARCGGADEHRLELSGASTFASSSDRTTSSPTAAISRTSCRATRASGTTSARRPIHEIKRMWEIGDKIAQGAAMMTDTSMSIARARLGVADRT